MTRAAAVEIVPDVCEIERVGPELGPDLPPTLLIEVPHGATQDDEFNAARESLTGPLPEDLLAFFHVNTDVGAPECARELARGVAGLPNPRASIVLRSLVPRTFCDCNRELGTGEEHYSASGITPAIPGYVANPADRALLESRHSTYLQIASGLYDEVCGRGGLAVIVHTYAPRSVQIGSFDAGIVAALRAAYAPERYSTWDERPAIDLITADEDGRRWAPAALVDEVRAAYRRRLGVEPAENGTYRLHPSTLGYRQSVRFPGQVLCLEFRRDLLVESYRPFEEMSVGRETALRWTAPLIEAVRRAVAFG